MAVTYTVIPDGGDPPKNITVEGTAPGCEHVLVYCSCWETKYQVVDVPGGAAGHSWSATAPRFAGCECGTDAIVKAECWPGGAAVPRNPTSPPPDSETRTVDCGTPPPDQCPTIGITTTTADECVNGKREVTVTISVTPALKPGQALYLTYGDNSTGVPIYPGDLLVRTHQYAGSAAGYTIEISTILPQDCGTKKKHVDVPVCTACCSELDVAVAVSDCTTNPRTAAFTLTVTPPPGCAAPTLFHWTVSDGSARKWHRTGGKNLDTSTGWTEGSAGVPGPIDLAAGGAFSVAVVPFGDNSACPGSVETKAFQVPKLCPVVGDLVGSPTEGDACNFSFSVHVENPCEQPLRFDWTFGDNKSESTTVDNVAHKYADGTTTSKTARVTVSTPGCADQVRTTTVTPNCPVVVPPQDRFEFSPCGVLILAWGVLHLVTGAFLYFEFWWGALVSGILATIALAIWIALCCWPCALKFWSCCCFLQWQYIFNFLLTSVLFGLFAFVAPGNMVVLAVFPLATAGFSALLGKAGCTPPTPTMPSTWPSGKCT